MKEKAINGTLGSKDTGEKVLRSIYKVKRADSDVYDRVHYETDSKMVCDATNLATPSMIVKRDSSGGANFGGVLLGSKLVLSNSLLVQSGGANISGGLIVNSGSLFVNDSASIRTNLGVDGTASIGSNLTVGGSASISSSLTATDDIFTTRGKLKCQDFWIGRFSGGISFQGAEGVYEFHMNKPIIMPSGIGVSTNLNADKVDGKDVDDSLITENNLWTAKKINDTKVNKNARVNAGAVLKGGGSYSDGNITIQHGEPGEVVRTIGAPRGSYFMVRTVDLDSFGHVSSVVTEDMSNIFATYEDLMEGLENASGVVGGQYIKHSNTDIDGNITGPARNSVNNVNMKNYSIDYNATKQCIEFSFV